MNNKKEVILITGAGRGIGATIAKRVAGDNRIIYINDISEASGTGEVIKSIKEQGSEAYFVKADVSDKEEVAGMFAKINQEQGRLDVLINNATPPLKQENILKLSWQDFQGQMDVLVKGAFNCSVEAVKLMKQNKRGHIISILSSCVVGRPPSHMAHYVTAKYALMGLSRSLGLEASRFGVRMNMVSPYLARTDLTAFIGERQLEILEEQHPMKRLARPEDTAETVAFLLSEGASYINLENIPITGGALI